MNGKLAFDNEKYLAEQTEAILERIGRFGNKLYLEFGGKLLFDYHASRVLPGFDPNVKMRLLQKLKDKAEIILCIYAGDIERRKVRADFGITYDSDAFKLIDDLRDWGLNVRAVVITRFTDQPAAVTFKRKLERRDVRVYTHRPIEGYPADVERIVSDEGYGANPYIETSQPLVVVTAPGPNSGKMATCLSQLYHDHKRGVEAGYAKFETFPIWNLPLRHPVNVAYEAATADLRDVNMIDPFHLEAYGETAINYNRDIEAFPLLRRILERITGAEAVLPLAHGHGGQPRRVRHRRRRGGRRGGQAGDHPPLLPLLLGVRHGPDRKGDRAARGAADGGVQHQRRRTVRWSSRPARRWRPRSSGPARGTGGSSAARPWSCRTARSSPGRTRR